MPRPCIAALAGIHRSVQLPIRQAEAHACNALRPVSNGSEVWYDSCWCDCAKCIARTDPARAHMNAAWTKRAAWTEMRSVGSSFELVCWTVLISGCGKERCINSSSPHGPGCQCWRGWRKESSASRRRSWAARCQRCCAVAFAVRDHVRAFAPRSVSPRPSGRRASWLRHEACRAFCAGLDPFTPLPLLLMPPTETPAAWARAQVLIPSPIECWWFPRI